MFIFILLFVFDFNIISGIDAKTLPIELWWCIRQNKVRKHCVCWTDGYWDIDMIMVVYQQVPSCCCASINTESLLCISVSVYYCLSAHVSVCVCVHPSVTVYCEKVTFL